MPHSSPLRLEVTGTVTIVHFLSPELLHHEVVGPVGDELFALVDDRGKRFLVLDFAGVQKVSSALLGQVMALHRHLLALQGRLVVCGLGPMSAASSTCASCPA